MIIDTDRFSHAAFAPLLELFAAKGGQSPVSSDSYMICPGLCDVHVHLREPGFSYKETIRTGSAAGARGGYTALCAMPNLNPVPDTPETLEQEEELIRRDAVIRVLPYGSITIGEKGAVLSEMRRISDRVCAFSDDGKGVQDAEQMRRAMTEARACGKIIAAHCEDESLLHGGYIHDGPYARLHGHRGISSESEYRPLSRDLALAAQTGVSYHVCHISTKESVALIRQAKQAGVDVTCETAPHYLLLSEKNLQEDGRYKMNPPLRSEEDRQALLEGIADGTIDMIATDHAPHSAQEKSRGLEHSLFGITGLEAAFPVLYTALVRTGVLTLKKLVQLMCDNPRRRFGIPLYGEDYTVFEIGKPYRLSAAEFVSGGKCTPFDGWTVYGKCMATVMGGKTVWQEHLTQN